MRFERFLLFTQTAKLGFRQVRRRVGKLHNVGNNIEIQEEILGLIFT